MAVRSHKLGPGRLTFGEAGSEYEAGAQATEASVNVKYDEGDPIYTLSGEQIPGDTKETATLAAKILQDYDLGSFLIWAQTNNGKRIKFTFQPDSGRELTVVGEVLVRPLQIGGPVKSRNSSDLEWQIMGSYKLVKASDKSEITAFEKADPPSARPGEQPADWD